MKESFARRSAGGGDQDNLRCDKKIWDAYGHLAEPRAAKKKTRGWYGSLDGDLFGRILSCSRVINPHIGI